MNLEEGVLYKFETKSCSICKMMEPMLQEFLTANPEVECVKVIATDEMDLCEKLGIMSMPTFLFIKGNDNISISGMVEKKDFIRFTKQFLKTL